MADNPVTHDQLRKELVALEERLTERMREQEDRLMGRMNEREERLLDRMREQEERLIERMRDMQTEIIRVFMEFQQRNESRDTVQEQVAAGLTQRVASMERRLLQIEAKLLLEPPAA